MKKRTNEQSADILRLRVDRERERVEMSTEWRSGHLPLAGNKLQQTI